MDDNSYRPAEILKDFTFYLSTSITCWLFDNNNYDDDDDDNNNNNNNNNNYNNNSSASTREERQRSTTDRFHNGDQIYYSFISIGISLSNLAAMGKIQKNT